MIQLDPRDGRKKSSDGGNNSMGNSNISHGVFSSRLFLCEIDDMGEGGEDSKQ